MSSKNFKVLHPKSVLNGLEFHENPYATNGTFNIYVPKEKDVVQEMIERDQQLSKSKVPHYYQSLPNISSLKSLGDTNKESKLKQKLNNDIETDNLINNNNQLDHPQTTLNNHQVRIQENLQQRNEPLTTKSHSQPKGILRQKKVDPSKSQSYFTSMQGTEHFRKTMQHSRDTEKLRDQLYFDERTKTVPKSTIKNNIIEDIVRDGEVFVTKPDLMSSIYKLKQLNLLKNHDSNVNKFPGVGKINFVFNDYHSKSTNNGYSRNFGGVFFTR